jgi:DNA-binding GntR family transcriptional regulator
MAARLACLRGDEAFRSTLREIKKKIAKTNTQSDPTAGIGLGHELHRAIMDAAQYGIMTDINKRLENMTVLTANITKRSPAIEKASAEAHLNIINVVLEQGQEKAEHMMREHLRETYQHIVERFYPGMLGGVSNNK